MKHMFFVLTTLVVLAAGPVSAHHGYWKFDRVHPATVEGTLVSLTYANPHVVMNIRTKNDVVYRVTWQAAGWVEYIAGVTKDTFKVGDHLVITGAPAIDPSAHELALVQSVKRTNDGWAWKLGVRRD